MGVEGEADWPATPFSAPTCPFLSSSLCSWLGPGRLTPSSLPIPGAGSCYVDLWSRYLAPAHHGPSLPAKPSSMESDLNSPGSRWA